MKISVYNASFSFSTFDVSFDVAYFYAMAAMQMQKMTCSCAQMGHGKKSNKES